MPLNKCRCLCDGGGGERRSGVTVASPKSINEYYHVKNTSPADQVYKICPFVKRFVITFHPHPLSVFFFFSFP